MLAKHSIWIVVLIMAAVVSYNIFAGGYLGQPKPLADKSAVPQNREVLQPDLQQKVTSQTHITQKILYNKCGDEEVIREQVNDKLIGMTTQQLRQVYQGWELELFDINEIVLSLQVDGFCRNHSDNMFVGIHNGYVSVFYGQPGAKALLKEETNIPLNTVQAQDQAELVKGIVVKDRSELLQTLEGLQEHRR